jgi:hypothetical protein
MFFASRAYHFGLAAGHGGVSEGRRDDLHRYLCGELSSRENPLDWGGDWNRDNTPRKAVSPLFPATGIGDFHRLAEKIHSGKYSGEKVDWGSYAARVSKKQIIEFFEETYRGNTWSKESLPHLYDRLQDLKGCLYSLPDEGEFALVAIES